MLCNGKYYVACTPNLQIQVSEAEHERIRSLRGEPLVEIPVEDGNYLRWIWVDDPTV
jgi:hypothetical protein